MSNSVLIKNDAELRKHLIELGIKTFQMVTQDVKDKIQDRIFFDTYQGNHGNYGGEYDRTWEFYDSFSIKMPKITNRGFSFSVFYDWEKMSIDPINYVHSSLQNGMAVDQRQDLARVLNVDGYDAGNRGGAPRKPFWTNAKKEIQNDMNNMILDGFKMFTTNKIIVS